LKKFNEIYFRLGVEFDSYAGESFYSNKMNNIINELKSKKLLVESNGAQVVDLSEYNMPPCIILKTDGATIYATRDLAAALYRKELYGFKKCLYVVGMPQALHFNQFFTVLKLMGYNWSEDCKHIGFAHVKFADGKMETRSGNVVFLEDVLNEAVKRVKEKINGSNIKIDDIDYIAEKVGIGAIKYQFLKASREREILFSWDETLDFNGESGPYIQYSYARAKSILRKSTKSFSIKYQLICNEEFNLIKILNKFKETVIEATERNEPSVITRYVYTVAKAFNRFYKSCQVIDSEFESQRLAIVKATSEIIATSLYLIGIDSLEKM
jgi:arginyl-tRNA synthetase